MDKLNMKLKGISNIMNSGYMFCDCKHLTDLPDISKWNTYNIINMSYMFKGCSSLKNFLIYLNGTLQMLTI